jgi:hypothetical protein
VPLVALFGKKQKLEWGSHPQKDIQIKNSTAVCVKSRSLALLSRAIKMKLVGVVIGSLKHMPAVPTLVLPASFAPHPDLLGLSVYAKILHYFPEHPNRHPPSQARRARPHTA